MESIKKQSLPSNPTAIPAPTWRFPSISAPGRHLCGAVSHVETLQAIRRVTTATAASRSQLPAPSSLLPAPSSQLPTLSSQFPVSRYQEQQVVPFSMLNPHTHTHSRLQSPLLSWPSSWARQSEPGYPVAGLNPRIDDYIILYYKFLIEYISSITPLGKIYLLSLQRATVKGFIHTHTEKTHTGKQSQPELPCHAELDELKLKQAIL